MEVGTGACMEAVTAVMMGMGMGMGMMMPGMERLQQAMYGIGSFGQITQMLGMNAQMLVQSFTMIAHLVGEASKGFYVLLGWAGQETVHRHPQTGQVIREKTPEELAEADRRLKTLRWVVSIFGSAVVGYFLMKFFKSRSWAVEFLKARRKRLEGAFGGPAQPPSLRMAATAVLTLNMDSNDR